MERWAQLTVRVLLAAAVCGYGELEAKSKQSLSLDFSKRAIKGLTKARGPGCRGLYWLETDKGKILVGAPWLHFRPGKGDLPLFRRHPDGAVILVNKKGQSQELDGKLQHPHLLDPSVKVALLEILGDLSLKRRNIDLPDEASLSDVRPNFLMAHNNHYHALLGILTPLAGQKAQALPLLGPELSNLKIEENAVLGKTLIGHYNGWPFPIRWLSLAGQ